MPRVLVVDDERNIRETVVMLLEARGFEAAGADTGERAVEMFRDAPFDAVIFDMVLPGMSGREAFQRIRAIDPEAGGIFMTAHGSIPAAVEAIRAGGYDYLTKPFDNEHLVLAVTRAIERRGLVARIGELEQDLSARTEFAGIIGRSAPIRAVLRQLAKVSTSDVTLLLTGESGTGKELAARSVHRASRRASGPFVPINCGAIPATLAEAELFGHERGAFTDAKSDRRGRFEQASGGTLFLDEVGDLPLDVQVKLLRALEAREICRVGAERPTPIDVRLVAATNRDLKQAVAAGRFRDDLYWRLNVVRVELPALRERFDDLPMLIGHLLDRANTTAGTRIGGLTPAAMARLRAYPWPGNIRQLGNAMLHGAIMGSGLIDVDDLPEEVLSWDPRTGGDVKPLDEAMALTERRLIEAALERFRGNRSAAAEALGIDRRTLQKKLRAFKP